MIEKMAFVSSVLHEMPYGYVGMVYPFHLSIEGLEKAIVCRDDEDYDLMVKYIFLCALCKNVIVVTYVVVSNHIHVVLLAENHRSALDYGNEIRRRYAMWFSHKYHQRMLYHDRCVDVQLLDTNYYLRNAIAYVLRNALDNGGEVCAYRWSGFRALFCGGQCQVPTRRVASLTKRESEALFHTNDSLAATLWLINSQGELEPVSCCDYRYAEAAFNHSQSFFFKIIGTVNCAQMYQQLVETPRTRMLDEDFFKHLSMLSERWFGKLVSELSLEQKARLLPYVYRTTKTSVAQLARGFGLERDKVTDILHQG